jgi:preprotein translocase subunit SecG
MSTFITSIHILVAVILMISVLLQTGKGSGLGAAFGGGSSGSVFGSRGPATFISRVTSVAAIVFMVTSFTLSISAQGTVRRGSVVTADTPPPVSEIPAEGRAVSEDAVQIPVASDESSGSSAQVANDAAADSAAEGSAAAAAKGADAAVATDAADGAGTADNVAGEESAAPASDAAPAGPAEAESEQ